MIAARKLAVAAALAATLGLAQFGGTTAKAATVTTSAATVTTFSHCTTGSSNGNITTCFTVYHSGRYVSVMRVSACDHFAERQVLLAILGPGNQVRNNDDPPGYWITPGTCHAIAWDPFRTVAAGTYCGDTYRASSTSGVLIGRVCMYL